MLVSVKKSVANGYKGICNFAGYAVLLAEYTDNLQKKIT